MMPSFGLERATLEPLDKRVYMAVSKTYEPTLGVPITRARMHVLVHYGAPHLWTPS